MKNILVPIDFSEASRNATDYAAALARDFKANLILLHIIVPPIVIEDTSASAYLMTEAEILEGDKERMKIEVQNINAKFRIKPDSYIREGSVTEIIRDFTKSKKADVIVMGMKGRGKSNSIFGSTTVLVMRKSKIPVFVIPEAGIFRPITNITLASEFDFEQEDYSILKELAEKYDGNIRIVNVQKKEEMLSVDDAVGKMNTDRSFVNYRHSFNTIQNKNVEKGIHDFLEQNPSDLLAMIAHKHSFFKRMFGTVHTKEMSYQTRIPLLVLPFPGIVQE
ncbi:MAG: universal stress protein [Ginsengibacter sp.]